MKSPEPYPGQESISDDKMGEGKLNGQRCEYCTLNATVALPIVRKVRGGKAGATLPTGTYSYACGIHKEIAEKNNYPRHPL